MQIIMDTHYTLRIEVAADDYRKVSLAKGDLQDVNSLIAALALELEIRGEFRLQYEDVDFGHQFMNLTDINDVKDKSTLKVIRLSVLDSDLDSLLDGSFNLDKTTESVGETASSIDSDKADTISVTSHCNSVDHEKIPWPKEFHIPKTG